MEKPEAQILVHFTLRLAILKYKVAKNRKYTDSKLNWTLSGQKYPVYTK